MSVNGTAVLTDILKSDTQLLDAWVRLQLSSTTRRADLVSEANLRRESAEFLAAFRQGVESGEVDSPNGRPRR